MSHVHPDWKRILFALLLAMICLVAGSPVYAGGPRWIAGSSYFNASAKGKPVVWAGGLVPYFLDQGSLSPTVSQSQARSMIATAAGVWNSVPTAAVTITYYGSLAEDVNGTNITVATGIATNASRHTAHYNKQANCHCLRCRWLGD